MNPVRRLPLLLCALSVLCCDAAGPVLAATNGTVTGSIDARLMRYPAVSATQIAFVYAGDIWVAPRAGGTAVRLSSPRGEESFPRFSPDGSEIAFSANYDGNTDIYVIGANGGLPRRITYHGASDRVVNWFPDGKHLLFASQRTSPRNRFNQFWKISAQGGLPERLAIPYGEFGDIAPDGRTLAYTPISVDFRTWKRYRGGMNPDIWLFDPEKGSAKNLTENDAADAQPMWHGTTLYFLSDRDDAKRANLWAHDTKSGRTRQVTKFTEFDVRFPSIGPDAIVFENESRLHLLDLASGKHQPVDIRVVTDQAGLKPRLENVSKLIQGGSVSPTGKRAAFEARGEIFTVPAEDGVIRNLTRTPGIAERFPAWSPDGKWVAYFTDRSGEYELALRPADGSGEEQTLTALGAGYRFRPQWSPDSTKLVFIDKAMKVQLLDRESKAVTELYQQLWMYHGQLRAFTVSWSADSRWITFAGDQPNRYTAIELYDTREKKLHQVTRGYFDDSQPTFDPAGKYLYFRTGRAFAPIYSDLDNTWIYPNSQRLAVVPLRKDVPSPLAAKNDDEPVKKDEPKPGTKKEDPDKPATASQEKADAPAKDASAKSASGSSTDATKSVEIDLEGFEARAVLLPTKNGYYDDLRAGDGRLYFRWLPRAGSDTSTSTLEFFDLKDRKSKRVLDDASGFELSANGQKLLVRRKGDWFIVDAKENQSANKKLNTDGLEMLVDPAPEWRQIFTDAWRLQRDFFYDPGLHGVDWPAMRERYGKLLDDAATRWDVNLLISELISELNASHTYLQGRGDVEESTTRGVGYLGCDFTLENGAYRIAKIITPGAWDTDEVSPLLEPGLKVSEGDYLLAVNGIPLDTALEPWAAFQGKSGETVALTVNDKPTTEGAREVLVVTLKDEMPLRYRAWIEENRRRVEELSDGKVGYVYVPSTAVEGQTDMVRQWRAQYHLPGLVIDERFNSGGQIPDRFVELLGRSVLNFWGVRDGRDWQWPQVAHEGPQAMLINGWSGSGGDCFPYYFKQRKLGPLIGMRTWGGLIGITGAPPLIDGGTITVPTFGIYDNKGKWIIENYGVDPDIEVIDDPAKMARGEDPQLERAVAEVLKSLKKTPVREVEKPKYPDRSGQ